MACTGCQKKHSGYKVTYADGQVKKVSTLQEAIDTARKSGGRYSRA